MTTRLAAIRGGDVAAFSALLEEHGAAVELLLSGLEAQRRRDAVLLRLWRDAARVDATAGERAYVVTTVARDLARALLPAALRQPPEADAANLVWHLARAQTGLGDELDHEIVADALRARPERAALVERWTGLLRAALHHPPGPLHDPTVFPGLADRLR